MNPGQFFKEAFESQLFRRSDTVGGGVRVAVGCFDHDRSLQ